MQPGVLYNGMINPLMPYAIAGGVPAKVIKFKWCLNDILRHEMLKYPENKRIPKQQLEQIMQCYETKNA